MKLVSDLSSSSEQSSAAYDRKFPRQFYPSWDRLKDPSNGYRQLDMVYTQVFEQVLKNYIFSNGDIANKSILSFEQSVLIHSQLRAIMSDEDCQRQPVFGKDTERAEALLKNLPNHMVTFLEEQPLTVENQRKMLNMLNVDSTQSYKYQSKATNLLLELLIGGNFPTSSVRIRTDIAHLTLFKILQYPAVLPVGSNANTEFLADSGEDQENIAHGARSIIRSIVDKALHRNQK